MHRRVVLVIVLCRIEGLGHFDSCDNAVGKVPTFAELLDIGFRYLLYTEWFKGDALTFVRPDI